MPKAMWIAVALGEQGYTVSLPDVGVVSRHPQAALAVADAEEKCDILNAAAAGRAVWLVDVSDDVAEVMGFTRA